LLATNPPSAAVPTNVSGRLVIISGPSGVGKGTVIAALRAEYPGQLDLSVSATTRQPRPGEVAGQHYHFLSRDAFETKVTQGEFLEYAEFSGNRYGTLRKPTEAALADGKTLLLEIEPQGARQVKAVFPQALSIFMHPPSVDILADRITNRATEAWEVIQNRLAIAKDEIARAGEFDVQVVNHHVSQTVKELAQVLGMRHG
jgi:guanylate kinase